MPETNLHGHPLHLRQELLLLRFQEPVRRFQNRVGVSRERWPRRSAPRRPQERAETRLFSGTMK